MASYLKALLAPLLLDEDLCFCDFEIAPTVRAYIRKHPEILKLTPPAHLVMYFRIVGGLKGILSRTGDGRESLSARSRDGETPWYITGMNHANATDKVPVSRAPSFFIDGEVVVKSIWSNVVLRSRFMPNALVFPGGKVDRSDSALFRNAGKDDEQRVK